MDFDEYDYLEKTVEETNDGAAKKENQDKEKGSERSEKGYRRRDRTEDDDTFEDEDRERERKSSSKKLRSEENGREREKDRYRDRGREKDRDRERSSRHRSREQEVDRERRSSRDKENGRDMDKERDRRERDKEEREIKRGREKEREMESSRRSRSHSRLEREERERERSKRSRSRSRLDREERPREKSRRSRSRSRLELEERERARRSRSRSRLDREERQSEKSRRSRSRSRLEREEKERSRRSRSRSRLDRERERDFIREREREESRRFKDKKEAVEPEADPERDQRTVFAYQMPLKATERDVFEFFSQVGKVRDVKLIMDRNSRRSKGVGYIEFYDVMSVPMAIALSGQPFLGQPVMVKPSEAEKNLVQSNTSAGGSGVTGPYGVTDRKLYVGNLHFNMTELQLKQIFEAFGPVELVQLPTDPETGHCKGFGFVQFSEVEHAKAAQGLNGKLEIAGRCIKVSSVTDHFPAQDPGTKTADFDDDDGGGLGLNAQSRVMLMAKLDRTGFASSAVGPLQVPLNGMAPAQQAMTMPINSTHILPNPILSAQIVSMAPEPIGTPSECLLLKNMFDPATEDDPEFDLDIKDDVQEECSKYGRVKHIHVDKNSAGYVYLRYDSVEAASRAQVAMHKRWFARRLISAIFLQPYEYDAKFKGSA